MSDATYIVRFVEVTPHEAHISARDGAEAIAIGERLMKALSPIARSKTFMAQKTTHEHFTAEPLLKSYRVRVEARSIYEIDVNATDKTDAEANAERIWEDLGPEQFEFQDFMDFHAEATEAEP